MEEMTDLQFEVFTELVNFVRKLIAEKSATPEERQQLEEELSKILGK